MILLKQTQFNIFRTSLQFGPLFKEKHERISFQMDAENKTRLVRSGKKASLDEVMSSRLPLKEPEVVDFRCRDAKSVNFLKTVPIARDRNYQRKAYMIIITKCGLIVYGQRCTDDTHKSVEAATRNANVFCFAWKELSYIRVASGEATQRYNSKLVPSPPNSGIIDVPLGMNILEIGVSD